MRSGWSLLGRTPGPGTEELPATLVDEVDDVVQRPLQRLRLDLVRAQRPPVHRKHLHIQVPGGSNGLPDREVQPGEQSSRHLRGKLAGNVERARANEVINAGRRRLPAPPPGRAAHWWSRMLAGRVLHRRLHVEVNVDIRRQRFK
jgi:hypothetical protein